MYNKSKRKWIIVLCIFFIVIYISLNFILIKFKESQKKVINPQTLIETNKEEIAEKTNEIIKYNEKVEDNEQNVTENNYKSNEWRILIPKINLDAPILEGTSSEILKKAVGHFENTSKWDGNVALAAHNRGYRYNFFEGLKRLEIGDNIVYQTEHGARYYKVIKKEKIEETNLSCLENTKENKLTLITCVENMPEYRLCIQAVLK